MRCDIEIYNFLCILLFFPFFISISFTYRRNETSFDELEESLCHLKALIFSMEISVKESVSFSFLANLVYFLFFFFVIYIRIYTILFHGYYTMRKATTCL